MIDPKELKAMWLSDLAVFISDRFRSKLSAEDEFAFNEACRIWKERTGSNPTVGEINYIVKGKPHVECQNL